MADSPALSTTRQVFRVDQEHSGLRGALILVFIGVWIVVFVLLNAFLPASGLNLLAVLIGLISGFGASALAERLLKGRWTSGRTIVTDDTSVQQVERGGAVILHITQRDEPQLLLWRFTTRRRSRVPKGWSVMACALRTQSGAIGGSLRQQDTWLPVYALLSPKQVEAFPQAGRFYELQPEAKAKTNNTPTRESLRTLDLQSAGVERRLREAENQRWTQGVEMTADDFRQYTERVWALFSEDRPL